jgi:hypothetical protein
MNTVRINGQDYTSSLSDAEIAFMGNFSLPTTAQTLSGAIAEHENDISELNSNLTMGISTTITPAQGVYRRDYKCYKFGKILVYKFQFDITEAKSNNDIIFSNILADYRPANIFYGLVQSGGVAPITIGVTPDGTVIVGGSGAVVRTWYTGTLIGCIS